VQVFGDLRGELRLRRGWNLPRMFYFFSTPGGYGNGISCFWNYRLVVRACL
jgi:hypothetical protein